MRLIDYDMSPRLAEEIIRLGIRDVDLAKKLGCGNGTIYHWIAGDTVPNAFYLAKLHKVGCDVIYILTGERTRNDQTGSQNNR